VGEDKAEAALTGIKKLKSFEDFPVCNNNIDINGDNDNENLKWFLDTESGSLLTDL
jgi:hypothetical protein